MVSPVNAITDRRHRGRIQQPRDIAVIQGLISSRGQATPRRHAAFPGVPNPRAVAKEDRVDQAALSNAGSVLEQADIGIMPPDDPGSRHADST